MELDAERAVALGIIHKSLGGFSMNTFSDRLRLQKSVYLLQEFGVKLGYDYSWYIRGPYCSRLAKIGFDLELIYSNIEESDPTKFMNPKTSANFKNFLKFFKSLKNDINKLELLASLHIVKTTHPRFNDTDVIDFVIKRKTHFTKNDCMNGLNELKKWGLL